MVRADQTVGYGDFQLALVPPPGRWRYAGQSPMFAANPFSGPPPRRRRTVC